MDVPPGSEDVLGKRRPDEGLGMEGGPPKRAHVDASSKPFAIKMLVSNKDAGTVIGKAGSTINGMQAKSGSRIRVSNNSEYYPGTMERVVMVSGTTPEIVAQGTQLVLQEVYCPQSDPQSLDQNISVNLLIPNAAAGFIIGKGGENIKKLKEDSAVDKIQLSAKEKQVLGVDERLVTVIGRAQCVIRGCYLITMKICEDPQIKFVNLSTQYKMVPPGSALPQPIPSGPPGGPGGLRGGYNPPGPPPFGGPPGGYGGPPHNPSPYDPYGQQPPYDPYGPPPGGYAPYPSPYGDFGEPRGMPGGYGAGNGAYGGGLGGGGGAYGGGYDAPGAFPAAGRPPAPTATTGPGGALQLQVSDNAVAAILGRGGSSIKEIMEISGAIIKVSQKGEYAPGTHNRIVTISGSPSATAHAHQLVLAKIPPS